MGWATDLQDASFRGVQFECTATTDAYKKALAIHQAPYSNDAEIEDMGIDPRQISITAMYTGKDYLTWTNALEAVLAQTGSGELIHPIYGILQVQVMSWQIQHDVENVDYCAISMEFVKAKSDKLSLFIPSATAQSIDTKAMLASPAKALETELKALERDDPSAFFNTISKIRNGLQSAYKLINGVKNTVDDIASPADWMYGMVNDVSRLASFDVTDISAISKWRSLSKKVQKIGDIFSADDESQSPALRQAWRATVVASQVAVAQQVVNLTRTEMAKANSNASTTNINESSLTPPELAVIRQTVRQDLQQAIRDERNVTDSSLPSVAQINIYKHTADQIHAQIQTLIETRPPLTTTIVTYPSTTHLLAHSLYGDFTRSSEILRLNPNLENPALLRTGQELVVYAR